MQEPETPEEWQAALDMVVALLALDAAARYGLARVDTQRCGEILRRAKALGYRPSRRTVEWVTAPRGRPTR
ncbi:MAG: hypothetical protein V4671_31565 [Armatimonadota bacterium]